MTSVTSTGNIRKSTIYVPNINNKEGGEETEIVTHIHVPTEGGWGWVVVVAGFICLFISDGMLLTFGSLFADVRDNLKVPDTSVALINSVAIAMNFFMGPVASAIINHYGFRECAMLGSVICCTSLLVTYFLKTYETILFFYGFCTGSGASFINLSSCLVVGFYFDRLRALAVSITLTGGSAGCMVMYIVNSKIVELAGWRLVVILQSAMTALIFFICMAYRPIRPLLVTQTTDAPASVYTSLPNLADKQTKNAAVQRMFQAVSITNFPTAAEVIQTGVVTEAAPSSSKSSIKTPKYTLSTTAAGISTRQLKAIKSVLSPTGEPSEKIPDITLDMPAPEKRGFWAKLCKWQKNSSEARPLYRDDIFYAGSVRNLDVYKKSVANLEDKDRFAIEYQMAVTRATTIDDIEEKTKICSIAIRRVLATMFNPQLLKCTSFLILGNCAFFAYLGVLVPYTFLQDRSEEENLPSWHSSSIISFIGLMNIIGRITIGAIACKISPSKIYITAACTSGVATMAMNFSIKIYYRYVCATMLGLFCSSFVGMRSLIIINLFGLDNLTNATGLMYIFQGLGSLLGTPLAMFLKTKFNYSISFYTAGFFMMVSGALIIPIEKVRKKELATEAHQTSSEGSQKNH